MRIAPFLCEGIPRGSAQGKSTCASQHAPRHPLYFSVSRARRERQSAGVCVWFWTLET